MHVDADLRVSLDLDGRMVTMRLVGQGRELVLSVDDPAIFAGRPDAGAVRNIAAELAHRGLVVRVRDAEGRSLIRLGRVRVPWWQRWATRSPHLRVTGGRGVWAAGRGLRRSGAGVLPGQGLLPPDTPWPLTPTLMRRPVRRATTTHDPLRGGAPCLVEVPTDGVWVAEVAMHWLNRESVTTIGSSSDSDVQLPGLQLNHAEVEHTADDDFIIHAREGEVRVHGELVQSARLSNSARISVGESVLTFQREEYADHGRPYGGRVGGEAGRQRAQPPRTSSGGTSEGPTPSW